MDDLGKSIPLAEGMTDAELGTSSARRHTHCLNCGAQLQGPFCHVCGQKDIPRRQTLGELWMNFISSFWSFEGKFFTTTRYLITRPGFLATEYNAGRRETYFHPARMYVFISFIFFLLFFSLPDAEDEEESKTTARSAAGTAFQDGTKQADLDSLLKVAESLDTLQPVGVPADSVRRGGKNNLKMSVKKTDFETREAYDSAQALLPEDQRDGWLSRKLMYRIFELNHKYNKDDDLLLKEFVKAFKENFSKILFFLLPFFALVLKLLYFRRDYFYSEHLVFSIYYYNFFYFAGSLQLLLAQVPLAGALSFLFGWWIVIYLLFGMKRMYGQSWKKTIAKFTFLFLGFGIFVLLALLINTLVIVMML